MDSIRSNLRKSISRRSFDVRVKLNTFANDTMFFVKKKNPTTHFQRLMNSLSTSLTLLGAIPMSSELESWSCLILRSMGGSSRDFHSIEHVFDVCGESLNPIVIISALFHDVVYVNVDGGMLTEHVSILGSSISRSNGDGGSDVYTLMPFEPGEDPLLAMVVMMFGFDTKGQLLALGKNEFLSAVVAVRCLTNILETKHLFQIAACIEFSIPFQKDHSETLYSRLVKVNELQSIGFTSSEVIETMNIAVELGNNDTANFALEDPRQFLSYTWRLMPEFNAGLRSSSYTIYDFHRALSNQNLKGIDVNLIFHSFRGTPDSEAMDTLRRTVKRNLEFGQLYIDVKLVSISVLASFALLTGGNCDISVFMGDSNTCRSSEIPFEKFEDVLNKKIKNYKLDDRHFKHGQHSEMKKIFKKGRKLSSSWDTQNSPISKHLFAAIGPKGAQEILPYSTFPMNIENAYKVLRSIPRDCLMLLADTFGHFAVSRTELLISTVKDIHSSKSLDSVRTI